MCIHNILVLVVDYSTSKAKVLLNFEELTAIQLATAVAKKQPSSIRKSLHLQVEGNKSTHLL